MRLLGVDAMRELDRRAVERFGLPVRQLMEVAGVALARAALELRAGSGPVVVLCGGGHNGGDGLAAARHLALRGVPVEVCLWADRGRLAEAPAANLALAEAQGIPVTEAPAADALAGRLGRASLVVDCLLGTGFRGPLRAPLGDVVEAVNRADRPVLAADVPSGLGGDLGPAPEGPVVRATVTLCFGAVKAGVWVPPGRTWAGEVRWEPLGIPEPAWEGLDVLEGLTDDLVARALPVRRSDAHKGTYGTVAVLAGSVGFAGAAALAAEGAARAGAGLVRVLCPAPVQPVVAGHLREATVHPLPADAAGALAPEAVEAPVLREVLAAARVLVAGPGLGRAEGVGRVLRWALDAFSGPVVLDADALNVLDLATLRGTRGALVITPHPGEAARLAGASTREIQADRVGWARRLAREGRAVTALKGAGTVVADPSGRTALCPTGNDGLATGGTGDVLAGVVAGLLAQGAGPWEAAVAGVYLHGRAADLAARRLGRRALLAGDVARALGAAFRSVLGRSGA
jgi:hydroxyethylthiazole kinase-like uncharacterized protein yjeF